MAQKQQKVKLLFATMVKNEAKIILNMLQSVAPYIDYWVIEDTGSTDGTQQIIRDFFQKEGIPGFLYEEAWKFHGYNRDHVLQKALAANSEAQCDFILRLDADELLEIDDNFDWEMLHQYDSWQVPSYHGDLLVNRKWIWRTGLPWYFQHDPIHETIHCHKDYTIGNLPLSFKMIVLANGVSYENPKKYLKDALDMENKLIVQTEKNLAKDDLYHLWYIAKSYYDGAGAQEHFLFGEEHSLEYYRRAKFYFESYLKLRNFLGESPHYHEEDWVSYTYVLLGRIATKLSEDWGSVQELFLTSHSYSPRRAEGLFAIAQHYFYNDDMAKAYLYTSKLIKLNNPFPDCMAFVESPVYADTGWERWDMHSVASYWIGEFQETKNACCKIIEQHKKQLNEKQLARILDNLRLAEAKLCLT
jgi:glycosyltransferase involved in cell wall biosynthesis